MGKDSKYYREKFKKQEETLNKLVKSLPTSVGELIDFKFHQGTALNTLISYCYDLRVFFRYYLALDTTAEKDFMEISYDTLNNIPKQTFIDYQKYLEYNDGKIGDKHCMSRRAVARKMAAVRNLYRYHLATGNITNNPTEMVFITREKSDKAIVKLTDSEIADILKAINKPSTFRRGRQRTYKQRTKQRDMALFVLLLNTGIRISECMGLDMNDVDLKDCSITIIRKGGQMDRVYFNPAVRDVLKTYIKGERINIIETKIPKNSPEKEAFFLSIQGKRWSVDSMEQTVRAYASKVVPHKHITPHKLRSTYGTALYKETGDIRLVAEVLGHDNINTTIKYYAAFDESQKKAASKKICFVNKKKEESKTEANENDVIRTAIKEDKSSEADKIIKFPKKAD